MTPIRLVKVMRSTREVCVGPNPLVATFAEIKSIGIEKFEADWLQRRADFKNRCYGYPLGGNHVAGHLNYRCIGRHISSIGDLEVLQVRSRIS
jgi:hypothetical protein